MHGDTGAAFWMTVFVGIIRAYSQLILIDLLVPVLKTPAGYHRRKSDVGYQTSTLL